MSTIKTWEVRMGAHYSGGGSVQMYGIDRFKDEEIAELRARLAELEADLAKCIKRNDEHIEHGALKAIELAEARALAGQQAGAVPEGLAQKIEALKHDSSEFGGPGARKYKGFEASRRSGWNAALSHVLSILATKEAS